MKSLRIVWQRLVDPRGQTCDRCQATYASLRQAVTKLERALRPLGIEVALEARDIDQGTFVADPSQSNRIWIGEKPLEEWLGASVESSPCCSVCGDAECRTIRLGNEEFEAVPSELILQAALMAAARLVGVGERDSGTASAAACCSDERERSSRCCP